MLQIVASLTDDSRGVKYDSNIFIIQNTGYPALIPLGKHYVFIQVDVVKHNKRLTLASLALIACNMAMYSQNVLDFLKFVFDGRAILITDTRVLKTCAVFTKLLINFLQSIFGMGALLTTRREIFRSTLLS
jgi:hypothetical protein